MIFAVHGPCFGAGTLIVDSNADYVVASPEARFGLIEMRWGLGGSATQVIRSLPWRIAMDMALRGRQMGAAEALQYGWLNAVVPREEVLSHARDIAEDYTHVPPLAARTLKRLALLNDEVPAHKVKAIREALMGRGVTPTPDQKEGMRAFVEKRRPNYTGKRQ
jgi:enoyl-CoA hydratase/carnithine racemase